MFLRTDLPGQLRAGQHSRRQVAYLPAQGHDCITLHILPITAHLRSVLHIITDHVSHVLVPTATMWAGIQCAHIALLAWAGMNRTHEAGLSLAVLGCQGRCLTCWYESNAYSAGSRFLPLTRTGWPALESHASTNSAIHFMSIAQHPVSCLPSPSL